MRSCQLWSHLQEFQAHSPVPYTDKIHFPDWLHQQEFQVLLPTWYSRKKALSYLLPSLQAWPHSHFDISSLCFHTANAFLISFDFSLYLHWPQAAFCLVITTLLHFFLSFFLFSFFGKQRIWIKSRTQKIIYLPYLSSEFSGFPPSHLHVEGGVLPAQLHFHDVSPFWPLVTLSPLQWN